MIDWIIQNQFFILAGIMSIAFTSTGWVLLRIAQKMQLLFRGNLSDKGAFPGAILKRMAEAEIKLEAMELRLALVEAISKLSIQKTGFLRFNPFHDTGGDNSFVIALLDSHNNGVMISSFYAREAVRVYAKNIEHGQSKYTLSAEEQKVLEETIHKK